MDEMNSIKSLILSLCNEVFEDTFIFIDDSELRDIAIKYHKGSMGALEKRLDRELGVD